MGQLAALGAGGGSGSGGPSPPAGYSAPWYKADAIQSVSDGSQFTPWPDSSAGNTLPGIQATVAHQGVFHAAQLNSLPAVQFDGVAEAFLASGTGGASSAAFSAFVLAKTSNTGASAIAFSIGLDTSTGGFGLGTRSSKWAVLDCAHAWHINQNATVADTSWHLLEAVYDGANLTMYLDGTSLGTTGSLTFSSPAGGCGIGSDGDDFWPGYVAEAIWYPSALNTAARQAVEAYFLAKWGVG